MGAKTQYVTGNLFVSTVMAKYVFFFLMGVGINTADWQGSLQHGSQVFGESDVRASSNVNKEGISFAVFLEGLTITANYNQLAIDI